MSITRYTASADTTITNAFKPYTTSRAYHANMGAADSLEFFSIAHSASSPEISRILLKFPIDVIKSNRQNNIIPPSGSVSFNLKLFNVQHPDTLPKKYYAVVKPVSGSWDEGFGLDLDNYTDTGQLQNTGFGANWIYRTGNPSSIEWINSGGDFYNGYDKTFYFDEGTEDVDLDITNIVESQITEVISADGLGIMLSSSYEDNANNETYYTKKFSARSSEYFYKRPLIEARWESFLSDDRANFYFSSPNLVASENSCSLLFYNKIGATHKDLPNNVVPTLRVVDSNNDIILDNINAIKASSGIYKATFSLTGTVDAEYSDQWYSGSTVFYQGYFDCKAREFDDSFYDQNYAFSIKNLKNSYSNKEKASLRVFGRERNWSPTVYKVSTTDIEPAIFNNLYYKIVRIVDNMTIIDYGVSPIAYTKCSYDKNGNYFDLDMSILQPGYSYTIKLMLLNGENYTELPEMFKFKVE
jgi:hypothetical protein